MPEQSNDTFIPPIPPDFVCGAAKPPVPLARDCPHCLENRLIAAENKAKRLELEAQLEELQTQLREQTAHFQTVHHKYYLTHKEDILTKAKARRAAAKAAGKNPYESQKRYRQEKRKRQQEAVPNPAWENAPGRVLCCEPDAYKVLKTEPTNDQRPSETQSSQPAVLPQDAGTAN